MAAGRIARASAMSAMGAGGEGRGPVARLATANHVARGANFRKSAARFVRAGYHLAVQLNFPYSGPMSAQISDISAARPRGRPWQPGQSGNPGGRPRVLANVQAQWRAHAEEALATILTILRDCEAPAGARISAARYIVDRAYGKPSSTPLNDDDAAEYDAEALRQRVESALAAAAAVIS
jgi:hypothetical protein